MKVQAPIPVPAKSKRPFIHNGTKDGFIKHRNLQQANSRQVASAEHKAEAFAHNIASNPYILQAFLRSGHGTPQLTKPTGSHADESSNITGFPLPASLVLAFRTHLGEDFSNVQIHADTFSTVLARQYNAAAVTTGKHIFMNTDVYQPDTAEGLLLLAHELFHTIEPGSLHTNVDVQLKPLTALNDQTPYQKIALQRAVQIAQGEQGKVNSAALNEDKTRVGWQYLVEYFRTTLGDDSITKDQADYKPGTFPEDAIKYVRRGKATKVRVIDGKHKQVVENNVDLIPSWCGIFVFWALHKAGIHPPKWEIGKPNFTSADQYRKGEYLPRPGDIVVKNGFNHQAMVVHTEPAQVKDTKDLQNVKVVTINGNTAGSNHQGGQIQEKTDPYSYWDYYVNPFFKGVALTPAEDYKIDERLKKSIGPKEGGLSAKPAIAPADTGVNQYSTTLEPVSLYIPEGAEQEKAESEPVEEAKIDPKEIMAQDAAFGELNSSLASRAAKEKAHDSAEQKAAEAQGSAVSPGNERRSKAKALKVEKLGALPPPKQFNAKELKENILKEVQRLLDEKKEEANRTGDKPKISDAEIGGVKEANNKDIKKKKQDSIGTVEEVHKEEPDEKSIEEREEMDVIVEDAGPDKRIPATEKAVAKPIADERITLEEESGNIDAKMEEHDVDEQQLEESEEEKFTGALGEKRASQAEAANIKEDYRSIENEKLEKDKKNARSTIDTKVEKIHDVREGEFGNVNTAKDATKSADELKRKEISDKIEKLYMDAEKSVNDKLTALETSVNTEFDAIMTVANNNFKKNCNDALDEEFTWEWAAKKLDREDYNRRVKNVFEKQSEKYTRELSDALDPLTKKIADTLNGIVNEIQAAKNAVIEFVDGLDPALAEIGVQSAKEVIKKFATLEESVNEKHHALTNGLAKKYADGVIALEEEFKKIMDSRKSWLEKALDAIVNAIMEIVNLFIDLKKALERAAEYGKRIIKAPIKFFKTLAKGASDGFDNFVKNIGKHLLQGALEWVTGEMADAGIQIPEKLDFKGILSIVMQILGITVNNIKEIAKKVIGEKYVALLEKGADLGVKAGDKILQVFTIIKKEGIGGLWEFIQEQFKDLKEKMMEEAKTFIIQTIIEAAVLRLVAMLIPGAGFIIAVKSLIDFLRTLFANARKIIQIIVGIIDTFAEVLAGNVSKVAALIENTLAKLLGLAITFLAAILGLGKIGKKINEIIQKKIKDPLNAAITKMMMKLKDVMTKLGVFKFLDKVDEKVKGGKKWVEAKKEKAKEKVAEAWDKFKKWVSLKKEFKTKSGESHSLYFSKSKALDLMIASTPVTFTHFINSIKVEDDKKEAKTLALKIAKDIDSKKRETPPGKNLDEAAIKLFEDNRAKQLLVLFSQLADQAAILFEAFGTPDVDPRFGAPDSKSQFGTSANILYLNKKFSKSGSPPTSSNTAVYELLNFRKSGGSSYYIKGHLLNQKMGGKGDWENLTPLSRSGNAQHETNVESVGKKFIESSAVISYDVIPKYDYGARKGEAKKTIDALKKTGDPDFDTKAKIIEAENYTPIALDCSATLMMKQGDKFVKGAPIFQNKIVQNEIDRDPKSYDISGEKKIMVYLDAENVPTLRKNLGNANFGEVLTEKIIAAYKKDKNIRRYDALFDLGKIVTDKDQDFVKDRLILFHK